MLFSKNAFFFLLLLLVLTPFLLPNALWILRAKKANGLVEGIGHASGISLGQDTYAYTSFSVGGNPFYFQGKDDNYEKGDVVPVLYQPANPEDARINAFYSLWGTTISYIGVPLLFWIICFFAPDIVPKRSKLLIGKKPFIKLVHPTAIRR